jgi:hypothetical protein
VALITNEHTVNEAANLTAQFLPEGWEVQISMEKDSGTIELYNPEGDLVEFPTAYETFADQLNDAIEFAIQLS